ncbi:hypothetical protein, partial [uncultured Proteiniphilum sp.]|uniref:hypothetical protein n=1 Tax=uncultured Proteiniphilum sp. TaxID=497637 RepID=UPI002619D9E2
MKNNSRRKFIRQAFISGVGLSMGGTSLANTTTDRPSEKQIILPDVSKFTPASPDIPFVPRRIASWWNTIEDLQWSQKSIKDKIKRRAEAFAEAKIDMVVNYGFHIRFDFSNYFGQLHGYMANVC